MKKLLYFILVFGLIVITYGTATLYFDNQTMAQYVKENQNKAVLGATTSSETNFMKLVEKVISIYPNYLNQ